MTSGSTAGGGPAATAPPTGEPRVITLGSVRDSGTRTDGVLACLKFLHEQGDRFGGAARELQRESGLFFDSAAFGELVACGRLDAADHYLCGFTGKDENPVSLKMFFELRKQKYLEALDGNQLEAAVRILRDELRDFRDVAAATFSKLCALLAEDRFRDHPELAGFGTILESRESLRLELLRLTDANPDLRERVSLPGLPGVTDMRAALAGGGSNPATAPNALGSSGQASPGSPFQPYSATQQKADNTSRPTGMSGAQPSLVVPTPSLGKMDVDASGQPARAGGLQGEASLQSWAHPPAVPPSPHPANDVIPSLPSAAIAIQSRPTAMCFHPLIPTLLLLGTAAGNVSLWAVPQPESLFDIPCQSSVMRADCAATAISWSPVGGWFAVAFAGYKGTGCIHLYHLEGGSSVISSRIEVAAHDGDVNDVALALKSGTPVLVSGGADGAVKVWDMQGKPLECFLGHRQAVCSLCPRTRGTVSCVFSTAMDGRIKAWLYGDQGSRMDYEAPGSHCTRLACSRDGARLFSCGVAGPQGGSTLVEWDDVNGNVKHVYEGFKNPRGAATSLDTTSGYIVAGDEGLIKVWEMDSPEQMKIVPLLDIELADMPMVRVNALGNLMVATTKQNQLLVLATPGGQQLLLEALCRPVPSVEVAPHLGTSGASSPECSGSGTKRRRRNSNSDEVQAARDAKSGTGADSTAGVSCDGAPFGGLPLSGNLSCIAMPAVSLQQSDAYPVRRLLFTNTGQRVLARFRNGTHAVWDTTTTQSGGMGESSWSICHQASADMVNEILEEGGDQAPSALAPACLAVSSNDGYMLSGSGGRVAFYNLHSFQAMSRFQAPPPAVTALAFHPKDNNVIALGLDTGSIAIYNVRSSSCDHTLSAHRDRVTGLAFCNGGCVLVSACVAGSVFIWGKEDQPEDYGSRMALQLKDGAGSPLSRAEVRVHSQPTQGTAFLTAHPGQLSIYSASSAAQLAVWRHPGGPAGGATPLTAACFSADGERCYAAARDGSMVVFSSATLTPIARIDLPSPCHEGPEAHVTALACSPILDSVSIVAIGLSTGKVVILGEALGGMTHETRRVSTKSGARLAGARSGLQLPPRKAMR